MAKSDLLLAARSLFPQPEVRLAKPYFGRHLHIPPGKARIDQIPPPLAAIRIWISDPGKYRPIAYISGRSCRYRCQSARSLDGPLPNLSRG